MKLIKRICLLVNFNLYESKRYFTEKLSEALRRKGLETLIIDANQSHLDSKAIDAIRNFAPDFTCSFNSFEPVSQGLYLWDFLKIPHVSFLVDPSFYSTTLTNSPYSMLTCVDRSDLEAIRQSGFKKVFFWPHAIEKDLTFDRKEPRPYEVVLLGSCYDYESLRLAWQKTYKAPLSKLLDDAIDIVFSNEQASLAEALVTSWNASKLDPERIDFGTLYYYLDNYTRGKDRVELIRSIKDARVDIFGELATDNAVGILNWKSYFSSQPNVTVHPPTLFQDGLNILKKSKIVLNSMPFFRHGSHERIFTGFGCGCLPITSESTYLREQFTADAELPFYSSNRKELVNDLVVDWLQNDKKREAAVTSGVKKVMKYHTWDNRADELLKNVTSILKISK